MEVIAHGLYIIFNGAVVVARTIISPISLVLIAGVLGLAWMAFIEIEELNRQSSKPSVRYH